MRGELLKQRIEAMIKELRDWVSISRIEGSKAFYQPLTELGAWNQTHKEIRKAISQQIAFYHGLEFIEERQFNGNYISVFKDKLTDIIMHLLPANTTIIGSDPKTDNRAYFDESPKKSITVKPFLIAKYPIMKNEYNGEHADYNWVGDNLPVHNVSRNDCLAWCKDNDLDLPSEVQWEFACRAGTTTRYYWGNEIDESFAWFDTNSGRMAHSPYEHSDKFNNFGLVDMVGNVFEWTNDIWIDNHSKRIDCKPYTDGPLTELYSMRGGSWEDSDYWVRSAIRLEDCTWARYNYVGFRPIKGLKI